MEFELAEGISFCETGDRFVFLDVGKDRYFCLPADAECSFRRLLDRRMLTRNDRMVLGGLASSGLLELSRSGMGPRPCPVPTSPGHSLLYDSRRARPATMALAVRRLAAAAAAFRLAPLRRIVRRLERRKRALCTECERPQSALADVAAAFRQIALFAAPLDRCLPRSVAAFEALLDLHVAPELVLGVRLRPFGAHCWVQHGRTLVNESIDQVGNFTPILVI